MGEQPSAQGGGEDDAVRHHAQEVEEGQEAGIEVRQEDKSELEDWRLVQG